MRWIYFLLIIVMLPSILSTDINLVPGEDFELEVPVLNIFEEEKIIEAVIICAECQNNSYLFEDDNIYVSTFNSSKFDVKEEKLAVFYINSKLKQVEKIYDFKVEMRSNNKTFQETNFKVFINKKTPQKFLKYDLFSKFSIKNTYFLFLLVLVLNYLGLTLFSKIDRKPISKVSFFSILFITSLLLTLILKNLL